MIVSVIRSAALCVAVAAITAGSAHADQQDDRDRLGTSTITTPGKETILRQSIEVSHTVTLDAPDQSAACEAEIELDYQQMDTLADVQTHVSVSRCDAASGHYTIRLTYRDEDDQLQSSEQTEPWISSGDAPRAPARQYPIGRNAVLLRIEARDVSCKCDDSAAPATVQ